MLDIECVYQHVNSHTLLLDVYNFQLSNKPAEELARELIDSSKGAFDQVFFVSGGMFTRFGCDRYGTHYDVGSEAMEGVIKVARQASSSHPSHRGVAN